jgi:hypothetical protein
VPGHTELPTIRESLSSKAAILGDILTFYKDLYANQAFLRTAQWRDSVSDLVRFRLSPVMGWAVEPRSPLVKAPRRDRSKGFSVKPTSKALRKRLNSKPPPTLSLIVARSLQLFRPLQQPVW